MSLGKKFREASQAANLQDMADRENKFRGKVVGGAVFLIILVMLVGLISWMLGLWQ
jgi:hypothetical protein